MTRIPKSRSVESDRQGTSLLCSALLVFFREEGGRVLLPHCPFRAPSWHLKLLGRIKGLSDQRTPGQGPTEKPAAIKMTCLFRIAMTMQDKRSKNTRGLQTPLERATHAGYSGWICKAGGNGGEIKLGNACFHCYEIQTLATTSCQLRG